MTSLQAHEELHRVEAGVNLGHIQRRNALGALLPLCDLAEGLAPESSLLNGQNVETYMVLHPASGSEELAVSVVHSPGNSSEAILDFDPRRGLKAGPEEATLVSNVVRAVMDISGVSVGLVDPSVTGVSEEVLEQAGFQPQEQSDMYALAA